MFIGILIPEGKKSRKLLGLAILAGILNTILSSVSFLPAGWSVIISIISISALGAFMKEEVQVNE